MEHELSFILLIFFSGSLGGLSDFPFSDYRTPVRILQ